ncbi:hypothetical protein, partial [Mycobacterium shimoidei]
MEKKTGYALATPHLDAVRKFFKIFLPFVLFQCDLMISLTPPEIDSGYGRKWKWLVSALARGIVSRVGLGRVGVRVWPVWGRVRGLFWR